MSNDDIHKNLQSMLDTLNPIAANPNQGQSIFLNNVLTPDFIAANSEFKTAGEFFQSAGIDFAATEEFEAVPEERLDALVQEKTKFADWQSMLNAAASQWGERSLSKD